MKRFERGILLFLVLILVLSSGSSYLALNQSSKGKAKQDDQKMTVALVNEDQGAKFNDQNYEFGAEFIKNIEKDNQQEWYVVSRGVAESGLDRNVYNMMIIIPNDFTQKALSIDSTSPEKVVLNYKINASDNSNMKAKAEKTASSILGDFNRRIIDVYFASVIGNLHDAQDNIGTLVKKEQVYTNTYNNRIHSPLAGYTSQFGALQSHTNVSRDSFTGLNGILKDFETNLGQSVQTSNSYQSSFRDYSNMQAANGLISKGFTDQLGLLDRDMNHDDVMQQLEYLSSANKAINDEFHQKDDQAATILSESAALQDYLMNTKDKIDKMDTELADTLAADMQQVLGEKLKKELKTTSGEEQNVYLNHFFAKPDENARGTLQKQIDRLPSMDVNDLEGLGLSDATVTQLRNVMAVTNKYNTEFGYTPNRGPNSIPLSDRVKQVKTDLMTKGVTLTDTVNLQQNKKNGQELTLAIPSEFEVQQVLLTLPNSTEMDYTEPFSKNHVIKLPANEEGQFTVTTKVTLKDMAANIDVFQPITWSWKLDQKDITGVDTPELPQETVQTIAAVEKVDSTKATTGDKTVDSTSQLSGETASPAAGEQAVQQTNDPSLVEKLLVQNNQITHQVMSSLTGDSTSILINASSDTVRDFQKLLTLYELYFGIGMDQFNRSDLVNELNQTNLKDLASEDSLYYLFNKQDVVDILANYVAGQITEEIRQQTEDLKGKIGEYSQLVNQANASSLQMANLIKETTEQAETLNTNLAETLKDLTLWREASLNLKNEQSKIVLNGEEEQSAILSLNNQFNTLLAASQSLADQSRSNLQSADQVYQTFDALDTKAKEIEASGSTLVQQAGDLSNDLTTKLAEDQDFADNFAGVLANSRIGERPNENLLSFLSNPVQTKNAGVIAPGDTFTPYFVVLICFIVALFTAYVISNHERKRLQDDSFAGERSIVANNTPITIMTVSIGLIEGVVIGVLSANLLQISNGKFFDWTAMITLIMVTMLLVAAYLLRQLKMVGMFILLVILSLYLFLTEALGLHFDQFSVASKLREYSPLQYIELLVMKFASGGADTMFIMLGLVVISLVSLVGHLFVFNRSAKSEEVNHEGISETL